MRHALFLLNLSGLLCFTECFSFSPDICRRNSLAQFTGRLSWCPSLKLRSEGFVRRQTVPRFRASLVSLENGITKTIIKEVSNLHCADCSWIPESSKEIAIVQGNGDSRPQAGSKVQLHYAIKIAGKEIDSSRSLVR